MSALSDPVLTTSRPSLIVEYLQARMHDALLSTSLYLSALAERDLVDSEQQDADQELAARRKAIDVERLLILSLDFNAHKFDNMRRMCRLAMVATIFSTMAVFLAVLGYLGRGLCVVLVAVWWVAVLLLVLGTSARHSVRDTQYWNRISWDTLVRRQ